MEYNSPLCNIFHIYIIILQYIYKWSTTRLDRYQEGNLLALSEYLLSLNDRTWDIKYVVIYTETLIHYKDNLSNKSLINILKTYYGINTYKDYRVFTFIFGDKFIKVDKSVSSVGIRIQFYLSNKADVINSNSTLTIEQWVKRYNKWWDDITVNQLC